MTPDSPLQKVIHSPMEGIRHQGVDNYKHKEIFVQHISKCVQGRRHNIVFNSYLGIFF